jgi:cytochrome c553
MNKVTRRSFVAGIGAASMVPAASALSDEAAAPRSSHTPLRNQDAAPVVYLFFSASEAAFIEAAAATKVCQGCQGVHGEGNAPAAIPRLAGQSAEYLTSALTSFQQRTRKNDPGKLMTSVAGQLNASDIAAPAAYFSSLPSSAP